MEAFILLVATAACAACMEIANWSRTINVENESVCGPVFCVRNIHIHVLHHL